MRGGRADHEEFLRATLRHADLLHTLATRLAPHPADAAHIVQETYLRAFAAWRRRRPDDVGAWLATICLNIGRDERRRHARRSAALSAGPVPDLADRADTAEAALECLGTSRVKAALWTLPDSQRIAVTLMDLCGFTAAQVAAITAAPRGTVLARVHRGRKALALILRDEPEPATPPGTPRRATIRSSSPPPTWPPCGRGRAAASRPTCWPASPAGGRSPWLAAAASSPRPPAMPPRQNCARTSAPRSPPSHRPHPAHFPSGGSRPRQRSSQRHSQAPPFWYGHRRTARRRTPPHRPPSSPQPWPATALTGSRERPSPPGHPPQLIPLNLHLAGAAAGQLDGVAVTMFAYRTPSGARLTILVGSRPFPEAAEARELGGTEGAWTMRSSGVTVICARGAHAMLLLGSDATLVRHAGALLDAI